MRLFIGRTFHGNGDSSEGELGLSMGLVLAQLALPGSFYSILLLEKYSSLLQWMRHQHSIDPLAGALPDEYFFIVLSMTVTGAVAVWRWDSIFPDRRDYSNLVALPLVMRNIFLANLAAILFLGFTLAVDVNAVSAVLFPLVVSAYEGSFTFFVHFVWVHAIVVVLASIFSFLAVFATIGILMVALPYPSFRQISLYVRATILAALLAMLATSFAVPSMLDELMRSPLRFLPPVWFLGLCQWMRGRADPDFASMGTVSLAATAIVVVAAFAIYAISYRRCFVRIPEMVETTSVHKRDHFGWIYPTLDYTILRSPFQRAGYRFAMKTLSRSERHGLALGGFFGLGVIVASQFLFASFNGATFEAGDSRPSSEILAIPLILSYCIILGVRFVLDIPSELRANWTFQICLDKAKHESVPLARKLILSFVFPWLFVIVVPLYGYLWGWRVGTAQAIIIPLWSLLLIEILLLRFRKIPFTCSYPPFRDSTVVLALYYILGFFLFVVLTSSLERWGLSNSIVMVFLTGMLLIAWWAIVRLHRDIEEADKELIFDEKAPPSFELLDLGHGS